jgi:hypothetical protein
LYLIVDSLHTHFVDTAVIAVVRIVIARSIREPNFARQFF